MFLRTKEEILMEGSLGETLYTTGVLTEDISIEMHSLMEKLGIDVSEYTAEELDESTILFILSEESEEDIKSQLDTLKDEIDEQKSEVMRKRNIAKALGWWTLGLFLFTAVASTSYALIPLAVLTDIAWVVTGICALVEGSNAKKAAGKLRGALPKLRALQNRAKTAQVRDRIAALESKIEETVAQYG